MYFFIWCGTLTTPVINLQCPPRSQTNSNISVTINNLDSREKQISGGLSVCFGGTELSQFKFKFLARQRAELKLSGVDVKSRPATEEWGENSCTQWHQLEVMILCWSLCKGKHAQQSRYIVGGNNKAGGPHECINNAIIISTIQPLLQSSESSSGDGFTVWFLLTPHCVG